MQLGELLDSHSSTLDGANQDRLARDEATAAMLIATSHAEAMAAAASADRATVETLQVTWLCLHQFLGPITPKMVYLYYSNEYLQDLRKHRDADSNLSRVSLGDKCIYRSRHC